MDARDIVVVDVDAGDNVVNNVDARDVVVEDSSPIFLLCS